MERCDDVKNGELRLAIMQKRIEHKLTQTALAEILHISQKSVSMWENGETVPREPMRLKLAQVFNLPIDYFLDTNENSLNNDKSKSKIAEDHDEIDKLAEELINKYSDQSIDLLVAKLMTHK